ncbi:hypothetical protein V8E36_005753 [Tilletia maclaganii]
MLQQPPSLPPPPPPPAGRSSRTRRVASGPASSAGRRSERSHGTGTLMDLSSAERQQLDETFALALQGRRAQSRRTSSSSTEAPSAAELSTLLTGLKKEERSRRRVEVPGSGSEDADGVRAAKAARAQAQQHELTRAISASLLGEAQPGTHSSPSAQRRRRSSASSAEEPALFSAPAELTEKNLNDSQRAVERTATRRGDEHRRPPAPTRGRRGEPHSSKRDASPVPDAIQRVGRSPSPAVAGPSVASAAHTAARSRRSPSPAPPSLASAAAIVQQAGLSHAGSRKAVSRRTSAVFDTDSTDGEAYKTMHSSAAPLGFRTPAEHTIGHQLVPMSRSTSKQHAKARASRASTSGGQSTMSRPAYPAKVARNLRRMMALTSSSDESDVAETASLASSSHSWRPSPRALAAGLGLRRWGYQKIAPLGSRDETFLPPPVTMKSGYNSSPETAPAQIRPADNFTAPASRFPRIWPSSDSDADAPVTKTMVKPTALRGQIRRTVFPDRDLEKGMSTRGSIQGHIRSHSVPTRSVAARTDLPFHERPFPKPRRMTRTINSSIGYFSDNGHVPSRPPSAQAMVPPPSVRSGRRSTRDALALKQPDASATQSVPSSPTKTIDHFAHMVLPPSFSPRPAEGIPPYFPLMHAVPKSTANGWAKWLSYGSPSRQLAADMAPGEVRRTAKAEAAYRLGLGASLPNRAPGEPVSFVDQQRTQMPSRRELKLAAAAAEASGNSAAARAYHMFAKRAYEKMAKTHSVPSQMSGGAETGQLGAAASKNVLAMDLPKSSSAPAAISAAAAALSHDKTAQLDKTLSKLAYEFPEHAADSADDAINTTPHLLSSGTPVPTDFPSDTDPNLTTPSDGVPPKGEKSRTSGALGSSAFRVIRPPVAEKLDPTLRLVQDDEKEGMDEFEKDEYARLLFDWDGMDEVAEEDDDLHDPQKPIRRSLSPWRCCTNVGGLFLVVLTLLGLLMLLPILSEVQIVWLERHGPGPNITLATVAGVENLRWSIIDPDTPRSALQRVGGLDGKTRYNLVFSDEFNEDQRTFEPGMDPWWEAVDLWYWGTGDYERYSSGQVTTSGGALRIKLEERPLGGLNFRSGMLQSWNKLCMNGAAYMEVSVQLPGYANVSGLWPAVFTLGNLGRAGYGATLEGMWPYSYNTCDVGTLANQTTTDGFPASAPTGGNTTFNRKHDTTAISFLPGQKLSACTCPQDDHPGPALSGDDGQTYFVGRSVPEIDIIEGQVSWSGVMEVSQSVQMAPFNYLYKLSNSTGPAFTIFNNQSHPNGYDGEVTQQSISYVTPTLQGAVEHPGPNAVSRAPVGGIQARPGYAVYGYEIEPGPEGYISWVSGGTPSFRLNAAAFDPDPISGIGRRVMSEEPMSIIMNLAISTAWSQPNWANLTFPATMSVDYVRIYAPASDDPNLAISCDPPNAPTADYIARHSVAYSNPNMTIWGGTAEGGGYEQYWPRNSLQPQGCRAPRSKTPGSPVDPLPKAPYVDPSDIGP